MRTTRQALVAFITVAFVATAVSGLVFVFPGRLLPVLPISLLTWRSVHEWTALAFTVALVVHLVLNRRRVVQLFSPRDRTGEQETLPSSEPSPTLSRWCVPPRHRRPEHHIPPRPRPPATPSRRASTGGVSWSWAGSSSRGSSRPWPWTARGPAVT
jgi:hypothetical protein